MRFKSVFIGDYKNLKNFSLEFDGDGFVDIFVGKNGSGKSNFLEALIRIFDHIYSFKAGVPGPDFDYEVAYEINGSETRLVWHGGDFKIDGKVRKLLGRTPVPDNVIVYYSGQNETVAELIEHYQAAYRKRVKGSDIADSPRFIGIGPDYKQLLLAIMLMQPEVSLARQHLCSKLGIEGAGETASLTLRRPSFAKKTKEYDPFVDDELFWGAEGSARMFLDQLLQCIKGDFTRGSLYDRENDQYRVAIDVALFREQFAQNDPDQVFRLFDALKALNMLDGISIPVRLAENAVVSTRAFSDGQFQSVYIFAISELFKNRQCLTLLDEPDAFLHPEWQYDFLGQVLEISEEAAKTNHILMSSHSASTIASKVESRIRLFEIAGNQVEAKEGEKANLINSLSAGLITFSETEARLNISHNLKNTNGPVLFTEGVSDEIILETAWEKLNPGVAAPFQIQSAFSASFLSVLLSDATLYTDHHGRKFFGIFDFDDAYNSWNINGEDVEDNPEKCLIRKRNGCEGYSMLLPVPADISIRDQIINPNTEEHYKDKARLSIELLFYDVPELGEHFEIDPTRPGECMRFKGKKTRFASRVVPGLDAVHFQAFMPIFDFIQSKIAN